MSSCGLNPIADDAAKAQNDLKDVLTRITQLGASTISLQHGTAACLHAKISTPPSLRGDCQGDIFSKASDLAYFSSRQGAEAAGAAFLLHQKLGDGCTVDDVKVALGIGRPQTTTPGGHVDRAACLEVLLMSLCLWPQHQEANGKKSGTIHGSSRCLATEDAACKLVTARPETVLKVAPGLVGHACCRSFKVTVAITEAICSLHDGGTSVGGTAASVHGMCPPRSHCREYLKMSLQARGIPCPG